MKPNNENQRKTLAAEDFYQILDGASYQELVSRLDDRQVRLAQGALTFHSLVNPGRELEYRFFLAAGEEYPRLTDVSTLSGDWAADSEPLVNLKAKSLVRGKSRPDLAMDPDQEPIPDNNVRFIRISRTTQNDAGARAKEEKTSKQKIYDYLEKTNPLVLDSIRETRIRFNERALLTPLPRHKESVLLYTKQQRIAKGIRLVRPVPPKFGRPKAILLGLHWFQTGGAERWAFEAVQIAKDAGFQPVVITDQLSHHLWINRPELEGALLLPMNQPLQYWAGDEPILRSLVETFDFQEIFIHHCGWLYEHLPWFKRYLPAIPVTDSLHIIEYQGGGYPAFGITYDNFIDRHHVISAQLTDWMVGTQKIESAKVVLAPLVGLTAQTPAGFKDRVDPRKFTVAFVGRLARQKRPDVFLLAANQLRNRFPEVNFIMHGDGELAPIVELHMDNLQLDTAVERRGEDDSVAKTLADADLLLLTSTNEGLALTVLEALSAGIPVISTDVGSQSTLVPPDALLPRDARRLLKKVVPLVARLKDSEDQRRDLWEREVAALEEFSQLPSGSEWMKGILN